MSHSKRKSQGQSVYLDVWNRAAKDNLLACSLCGHKGFDPKILAEDFLGTQDDKRIVDELVRLYEPLELDESGHCETCRTHTKCLV